MNNLDICADSIRAVCPLFQGEGGGSTPTSALQLQVNRMESKKAVVLNNLWHSRLPELTNWQQCFDYSAQYDGLFYAVALWGQPIARMLNGRGWLELRRMAIADDAPKNTASRMIGYMVRDIRRNRPDICRLISYQDTAVHAGTIYAASGWNKTIIGSAITTGWNSRIRNHMQTAAPKIRWDKEIRPQKTMEESQDIAQQAKGEMAESQVELEL